MSYLVLRTKHRLIPTDKYITDHLISFLSPTVLSLKQAKKDQMFPEQKEVFDIKHDIFFN